MQQQIQQVLETTFGFKSFREGQLEAIETLLEQGRLLSIQPTGHGKSLLYQLPACILPNITVVISPLLALMRDQVQQLNSRFKISAASINSDQDDEENFRIQRQAKAGQLKILFVAPEKLANLHYFKFLTHLPMSLIVIDEAHCISTWGHDFRPGYREILNFVNFMQNDNHELKVLALTATANKKTAADIVKQLVQDPKKPLTIQRCSMNRPNLQLQTVIAHDAAAKLDWIKDFIQQEPGVGLIYCATRDNTTLVADYLQHHHIDAAAYHAGFSGADKKNLQTQFIENRYKVIAATNALGMGIDKQDLRFIIHFDVPGSISAYYQEVGRCGRDGKPAKGLLVFCEDDIRIQRHFINASQPSEKDFDEVISTLKSEGPLNLQAIKVKTGLHPTRLNVILAELQEQNFVEKQLLQGKQKYQLILKPKNNLNLQRYRNQYLVKQNELKQMLDYANDNKHCLMSILRNALADKTHEKCGQCSNCQKQHLRAKFPNEIITTQSWLQQRTAVIASTKTSNLSQGVAVLNGQMRSKTFVAFMQQRAKMTKYQSDDLWELIKQNILSLKQQFSFSCILVMPSRTWLARDFFADQIATVLNVPVFLKHLFWKDVPAARQGELLNNDQRKHNVHLKMAFTQSPKLPKGNILLLDDYVGSGATLNEAARVLRKQAMIEHAIVPFTVASVRWRLGSAGMV